MLNQGPEIYSSGSAEAALHSEKDPYGDACSSRLLPMPSRWKYSISEDTLHQLRWGRREALGPGPFHPSWFCWLGWAPRASSCHLCTPLCLRPLGFWLKFVGVRRGDSTKSGTFCGLSATQKNTSGLSSFLSKEGTKAEMNR